MRSFNKSIGTYGEEVAEQYLKENGYYIMEKNFRCKTGEIDIIARDKDYITFIEVKTRYNNNFGNPCEAVTFPKQKKLYKSAQVYLLKQRLYNSNLRFDVIEVLTNTQNNEFAINLIKNAFQISI